MDLVKEGGKGKELVKELKGVDSEENRRRPRRYGVKTGDG